MADLTVQSIVLAGLDPSYDPASPGGDQFINDGKTYVHIKNGGAGAIVATFDSVAPCDQGFDHNEAVSIPAGAERKIAPFGKPRFNNTSGKVAITYDDVTSVTIGAFKMP
jgi:hypothetical protein